MSTDKLLKILVCGDVEGRLNAMYKRVSTVQKKAGNFDILFCVGNFFDETNTELLGFITGAEKAIIPTVIVGPLNVNANELVKDPNGCELCPNITFLGRKGVYTDKSSGLRVVYLSSVDSSITGSSLSLSDVTSLMTLTSCEDPGYTGVDIMLTAQWPAGVERLVDNLPDGATSRHFGSKLIAQLAQVIRPRYHFSGLEGIHYERRPYRNHQVLQEKDRHVTRFVALAKVKNPANQKYMYAIQLKPIDQMDRIELVKQPDDVTESPYLIEPDEEVVAAREIEVQTDQFFFDMKTKRPRNPRRKRDGQKNIDDRIDQKRARQYSPCWFCLGNPQVEKHLVVSVGMHAYLAMPRGPLVPDHVLILPVGHHQSWIACTDAVRSEIELYKTALRRMTKDQNKVLVIFERNFKSHHLQLQIVPVPLAVAGECKHAFLEGAKKMSPCFDLQEIPNKTDINEVVRPGIPYFYVELPTKEKLLGTLSKELCSTFDIQFGRTVLASSTILNCQERIDWRKCTETKEDENDLTQHIRDLFAPFDFNNAED